METTREEFRLVQYDADDDELLHVISITEDGRPYDAMHFPDGAYHGGGHVDKWDT